MKCRRDEMKKEKNKKKTAADYIRAIRKSWGINPMTRVLDDVRKDKKKRRREEKKLTKDE